MFCIILKHHFWEQKVEVIHSLIALFILLRTQIADVGIEATSYVYVCAHSADKIRYDVMRYRVPYR